MESSIVRSQAERLRHHRPIASPFAPDENARKSLLPTRDKQPLSFHCFSDAGMLRRRLLLPVTGRICPVLSPMQRIELLVEARGRTTIQSSPTDSPRPHGVPGQWEFHLPGPQRHGTANSTRWPSGTAISAMITPMCLTVARQQRPRTTYPAKSRKWVRSVTHVSAIWRKTRGLVPAMSRPAPQPQYGLSGESGPAPRRIRPGLLRQIPAAVEGAIDLAQVEGLGVERFPNPLDQVLMLGMLRLCEHLEQGEL